jgi:phage terminase large subunit-like protein
MLEELTEGMTDAAIRQEILYNWDFWAREKQKLPGGDWFAWLILSGRGFGKTRTGAEAIKKWEREGVRRFALVAETSSEARDVMVEGESGLLACYHPQDPNRPEYYPSKRRLEWPGGAMATTYSGEEPGQLRGPQHEKAWVDELAKYKYPEDTWDQLSLGLRLGEKPQAIITTTPRPIRVVKALLDDPDIKVTKGSSYENKPNLAPAYVRRVIRRYEGTTLGRQELHAEVLTEIPGALWQRLTLDRDRADQKDVPDLVRVGVGVDPPGSSDPDSGAEAGIIVAGLGTDGHGYVLTDLSRNATPHEWGSAAVSGYEAYEGDRIIAERNFGGDMVESTIRTVSPHVPVRVISASRGKQRRAEPIAALYEQGMVHHVGTFGPLEDQMCTWLPPDPLDPRRSRNQPSPDRMDALVWVLSWLMLGGRIEEDGWAEHKAA